VKLKISLNIFDILINLICVMTFASSYFDIIYRQGTGGAIWLYLFNYSIYIIAFLSAIFIWIYLYKERRIYSIVIIMLLVFIYEVTISWVFGILEFREIIRDNLAWILVFCCFYCYAFTGRILGNQLFVQIINMGTAIFCILIIPNVHMHMIGIDARGNIIGPLYYSFGFLGLVLLYSGRNVKIFFSIVMSLMILLSEKRTGFAIIIIGLLLYGLVQINMEGTLKYRIKKYIRLVVIVLLAAYSGYWFIITYDINIIERLRLLLLDGDTGSGRLIIWRMIINYVRKSSLKHKILGYGFHAVPKLIRPLGREIFAHNCFLEILFDFGFLGLAFVITTLIWCSIKTLKMFWYQHKMTPIMAYVLVVVFLLSMFGYFFEEPRFIMPVMILCGMCIGTWKENELRYGGKK